MDEILLFGLIFVILIVASLGVLLICGRMPLRYRQQDTHDVVRLAANIFVVMTSLVLGLLINSAKNTLERVDQNVHGFATELIVLDRTLRRLGGEANDTRRHLALYIQRAVEMTWPAQGEPLVDDSTAERLLDDAVDSLQAIRRDTPQRLELWRNAETALQNIVRRRWTLVEESEGALPTPLLAILVAWLSLVFASFGYRAPRNAAVGITLVASAFLISGGIYLVIDMQGPFSGPIQVSPAPMQRALEQMRRGSE